MQGFSCLQNSVSTWSTISAGSTETPWIDYKNTSLVMADSTVGVSIHHTINFREKIPELKFNALSKVGSMGQTYLITSEGKRCFPGQGSVGAGVAHVSMYSMHFFVSKDFEYT